MSSPGAAGAVALIRAAPVLPARPWPRHVLGVEGWGALARALESDPLVLLALWAEASHVHALFLDDSALSRDEEAPLLASVAVEAGRYAALSPARPGAAWFERMIRDLWGHEAMDGVDHRPWLDHGRWPQHQPMSPGPLPGGGTPEPPEFLPVSAAAMAMAAGLGHVGLGQAGPGRADGSGAVADETHQVALGPVGLAAAGVDGAAHLRLTVHGDGIVQAEALLGYGHRGVMALMRGRPPREAARLAARLSGTTPVAHACAFARAAEAALGVAVPPRGAAVRALVLELERLCVHLGEMDALAATVAAPCAAGFGVARERMLRACDAAFGQRLMLDTVVPGGVALDLLPEGEAALQAALGQVAGALPELVRRCDGLLRRAEGRGLVPPRAAALYGAGGVAGRASGRGFDARLLSGPPPPAGLRVEGDAAARIGLRLHALSAGLGHAALLLGALPAGEFACALPAGAGEGLGVAEGARGDCWAWLRLDGGVVASVFQRDPGWALWPLLELAARGESVDSLALVARSLGCDATGVDL